MRRIRLFAPLLVVLLPAASLGETAYLRDGSTIRGTVVSFVRDTLEMRPSFGGTVRIPRDRLVRIDFADSAAVKLSQAQPAPTPVMPPGTPYGVTGDAAAMSGAGKLRIEFDDVEVSSTIAVHRDIDRAAHERENVIETLLSIDGQQVYVAADSSTDKVIRKGVEVLVRNKATPKPIEVGVSAGLHNLSLHIGNTRVREYGDRFEGGKIDETLRLDSVLIRPGMVTRITVGLKRKKLGLAGRELRVVEKTVDKL